MAAQIPDLSLVNMLQQALGTDDTITLRLFKNPIMPSSTIGLGQLTEADYSGYTPVTFIPAAVLDPSEDGIATTQTLDAAFEHNGGSSSCNVYGWFITQDGPSSSKLVTYEQDADAPIPFVSLGDGYDVSTTILAVQE